MWWMQLGVGEAVARARAKARVSERFRANGVFRVGRCVGHKGGTWCL